MEIVCPRCGKPGRLVKHTVRSKGREYTYIAVKHVEGGRVRRCLLRREEAEEEGGGAGERAELGYEDVLEALSALYARARRRAGEGDPSELEELVVFIERKLTPLLARMYDEARSLLSRDKHLSE